MRRALLSRFGERLIEGAIVLCGLSAIFFVIAIFLFVFLSGADFMLHRLDWVQFLTSAEWYPTSVSNKRYGTLALIAGTASVTGLAMLVAVPFGLGTAVFISEFTGGKTKEILKIVVELLAAIPSVVWGFIGLAIMNPLIIQLFNAPIGLNVLNGGIILGLMSVPIIVSIGEDALKAVPDSYREAVARPRCDALADRLQGAVPGGKNGLLAAVLLGVGRGDRRDHGGAHGHRARRSRSRHQPPRFGAYADRHDRRRARRDGAWQRSLPGAVRSSACCCSRSRSSSISPPTSWCAECVAMSGCAIRASAHTIAAERRQSVANGVLGLATAILVLPLVAILGLLVIKGGPALSWEFLFTEPAAGMTAGGIYPAIVGTFWLMGVSLAISVPIGVLAAIYLNEYAGDNWLTRLINLAVVNLAGVPSIVHALFGVGAFVFFAGFGTSISASLTLAIMTLPVIIASTREALARAAVLSRSVLERRRAALADDSAVVLPNSISGILTGVILQVSRAAGETAPILFTGAVFYVAVPDQGLKSFLYGLGDPFMALSYHLFTISTQVTGVSEALQYGTAVVLIGLVISVNLVSIGFRVSCAPGSDGSHRGAAHRVSGDVTVSYRGKVALDHVSLDIPRHQIFGIIGPANSGKTTLLKCINRMIDFTAGARVEGQVFVGGEDVVPDRERVRTPPKNRHGVPVAGRPPAVGV